MGVPEVLPSNKNKTMRPVSDRRRIRKPIMEKKRRDRINSCLEELSSLLLEEKMTKEEPGKANKMEKADILELTVKYWQSVRSDSDGETEQEALDHTSSESNYLTGYRQCISMVDDILKNCEEPGTENLRQALVQHLATKAEALTTAKPINTSGGYSPLPPPENEPDKPRENTTTHCLTLIPTRLSDGSLALVLQGEAHDSTQSRSQAPSPEGSVSRTMDVEDESSVPTQSPPQQVQQVPKDDVSPTQNAGSSEQTPDSPMQTAHKEETPRALSYTSPETLSTGDLQSHHILPTPVQSGDPTEINISYVVRDSALIDGGRGTEDSQFAKDREMEVEVLVREEEVPLNLCVGHMWRPW